MTSNAVKRGFLRTGLLVAACGVSASVASLFGIHVGDDEWGIFILVALVLYYVSARFLIKKFNLAA